MLDSKGTQTPQAARGEKTNDCTHLQLLDGVLVDGVDHVQDLEVALLQSLEERRVGNGGAALACSATRQQKQRHKKEYATKQTAKDNAAHAHAVSQKKERQKKKICSFVTGNIGNIEVLGTR